MLPKTLMERLERKSVFSIYRKNIYWLPCRMDGPVAGQLGGTRDTGGWLTPILLTVTGDLLRIESPIYSKQPWKYDKIHFVWNGFPLKVCLTVRFENLCDGSLHIGSRVEATRGQRTPCPRTLHLNIGQLSRRELSFYANSGFLCYDECGVTVVRWWDGVVRTLPTPGLLGTSPDTDRLHLAVVGRELGAGQLRGAQQRYTDTASTFCGEFPCFREGRAQAWAMFCDRICSAWDRVTSTPHQWDNWGHGEGGDRGQQMGGWYRHEETLLLPPLGRGRHQQRPGVLHR